MLKSAELSRKQEIVKAAEELFFTRGYDQSSIGDIIKKVGISKGGFYHYFKSKEQLLDELVEGHVEKHIKEWRKIRDRKDIGAINKLKLVFQKSTVLKSKDIDLLLSVLDAYTQPSNLKWRIKQEELSIEMMSRELTPIIYEGIEEGVFQVKFPDSVFKALVAINNAFFNHIVSLFLSYRKEPKQEIKDHICDIYEQIDEYFRRLLGIQGKGVSFFSKELIELFFSTVPKTLL